MEELMEDGKRESADAVITNEVQEVSGGTRNNADGDGADEDEENPAPAAAAGNDASGQAVKGTEDALAVPLFQQEEDPVTVASGRGGGLIRDEENETRDRSESEDGAPKRRRRRPRGSSLELRQVVLDHILVSPEDLSYGDDEESVGSEDFNRKAGVLQRACLNPRYSLRTQMMLSFGIVSAITILFVMITSIVVSIVSGDSVKTQSRENLERWVQTKSGSSLRYVAEAVTPKVIIDDIVQILFEATRDRFVGYPNDEGYESDSNVPFLDVTTGGNKYPLESPPLPPDWKFEVKVNEENHREHVQGRWPWYAQYPSLSTANAMYHMQGACDPNVADQKAMTFYPNCSDANNNITTGGVVVPTLTNEKIARRAADLSPLLKALFEYHQDVKSLGVYFANAGAGSVVYFPHYELDSQSSYTSVGCDWMKAPNPFNPSRPIAPQEEIERCRPNGTIVSSRDYNPLERAWCRDQALDPAGSLIIGPYLSAWSDSDWFMSMGRAVYDRKSKNFIACILIDFTPDHISRIIEEVKISDQSSFTLVRWDDEGTVVASPHWNSSSATGTTTVLSIPVGVNKATFERMKSLVNFSSEWDPQLVRTAYQLTFYRDDGKVVSSFPIPAPPDTYDPDYHPDFILILSIDEKELFRPTNDVYRSVDETVKSLVIFTLIVGFVGLAAVILIIYLVSHQLTEPLQWMNNVADQIVDKFGQELGEDIEYNRSKVFRFSPKTELGDVVKEFQKMMCRFSGKGTAKSVKVKPSEVKNQFALSDEFLDLYQSRKEPGFQFGYADDLPGYHMKGDDAFTSDDACPAPDGSPTTFRRCHFGPNVHMSDGGTQMTSTQVVKDFADRKNALSSPLFWWIVAFIVTPLLITTITISAVVTWRISTQLPSLVTDLKVKFVALETESLSTAANMRAIHVAETTERAVRDLHVLTRFAGWLLFGGIQRRTDSFTAMITGAEECKTSAGDGTCKFFENKPCDCRWNDAWGKKCRIYSDDTRYLQRQWYESQSQDTRPENGDRNSTSFPALADMPNTTAWWDDVEEVPGSEKRQLAAGHETTYDRLRVLSALSVAQMPLYNYDISKNKPLGTYLGFEADGMFVGYTGCSNHHAEFAFWMASVNNSASKLRPEICPHGKFGYDPRCRDWYAAGRNTTNMKAPLYLSPPYLFADNDMRAQSCSSPLVDPDTQEHIGQALVDFIPNSAFVSLLNYTPLSRYGFPILFTPQVDISGADTVIGPGYSLSGPGMPIEKLVVPYDHDCSGNDCVHQQRFREIVEDMQAGGTNSTDFSRTRPDGSTEVVYISYAPVYVNSFRPMNSSDFSRGVTEFKSLVYLLALAEPEDSLLEPFQEVEETIQKQVHISIGILAALIVVATAFVIYISSRVTMSLIAPIRYLLQLIRSINRLEIEDDIPHQDESGWSSREVSCVYDTMEMLYKVVRFANSAFFSGNLEQAYDVLVDALVLFKRLDNKKAIAVASNNLGNTMLTMYRTIKATKETHICEMSKKQIITKGIAYFHNAIKLGEEEYDRFYQKEGWSKDCLVFMQQLSNRYFNRGMFLLTVKDDHEQPDEAEHLGRRDMDIVRDMDVEIVDQCAEVGFTIDRTERYELNLGRIRGLLMLMKMSYPDEWDLEERIDEAVMEFKNAIKSPLGSNLFDNIGPAGRMQELDNELLKYVKLSRNDVTEAARIGIRMLVEDEYIFPGAMFKAVKALIEYADIAKTDGQKGLSSSNKTELLMRLDFLLVQLEERFIPHSSFSEEVGEIRADALKKSAMKRKSGSDMKARLSVSLRETNRGDVTMEKF